MNETPTTQVTLLLIEDDASLRRVMEYHLQEEGYRVLTAGSGEKGLEIFGIESADLVVTDITMPGLSGMDVLREVKVRSPDTEVILITAYGTIEMAVQAMKEGAYDYITKPFNRDELKLAVKKALRLKALAQENLRLRAQLTQSKPFGQMVARSPQMLDLLETAARVAASDATVLILGESGTGKELLARAIHEHSSRAKGPFVTINCGAIPEALLESELFGHEKGAFTGAHVQRRGRVEYAQGGTLFLDEVGDLPLALQVKLLRFLQEQRVERVGGREAISVDARIVAATNRDLEAALREGSFREDLYYRLGVITLEIPPLRERREDIPLLVDVFVRKFNPGERVRVEDGALDVFLSYAWPGNVRELENVIQRGSVLRRGAAITLEDLPQRMLKPGHGTGGLLLELPEEGLPLDDLEKTLLQMTLEKFSGNQSQAARYLGISRPTLIYRIEKYGIKRGKDKM